MRVTCQHACDAYSYILLLSILSYSDHIRDPVRLVDGWMFHGLAPSSHTRRRLLGEELLEVQCAGRHRTGYDRVCVGICAGLLARAGDETQNMRDVK